MHQILFKKKKIVNGTISKQKEGAAMETPGVLLLFLLLLCAVSTCWGQQGNLVDKLGILSVISQLAYFTAIGDTYELCIIP